MSKNVNFEIFSKKIAPFSKMENDGRVDMVKSEKRRVDGINLVYAKCRKDVCQDGGKKVAYQIPYQEIGLRIRALREANSYTRDAFAERVHISAKFLYEIEMGKKGFSVEILYKISNALSTSTDYLILGKDSSKISSKTADILECFTPDQLAHVQDILKTIQQLCTDAGNRVQERMEIQIVDKSS